MYITKCVQLELYTKNSGSTKLKRNYIWPVSEQEMFNTTTQLLNLFHSNFEIGVYLSSVKEFTEHSYMNKNGRTICHGYFITQQKVLLTSMSKDK
jgi:hypothetical protein